MSKQVEKTKVELLKIKLEIVTLLQKHLVYPVQAAKLLKALGEDLELSWTKFDAGVPLGGKVK